MSKLIESLKAGAKKTTYEMTQQQLADIYFAGSEKLKRSDEPLVIKVIEKPRSSMFLPWMISSVALLVMAFSLFSTKRVFIDIKVIDDRRSQLASAKPQEPEERRPAAAGRREGRIQYGDKLSIDDFVFEGAAKLQSSKDRSGLTLVNSSVAPFARASLYFNSPLDLRGSKIVFYAKGGRGGENIAFSVKDQNNHPAFEKGRLYPFPSSLTTDWQRAEVPVYNAVPRFDEQNVASFRFDVGSKDTENKPGDTVYIRDLQIIPI